MLKRIKLLLQKLLRRNSEYISIKRVLVEPPLPNNIPEGAIWHAGEGAGSWFFLVKFNNKAFNVTRYSSMGVLEANGRYISNTEVESNLENIKINYPSNCAVINLSIDNTKYKLIYCDV